MSLQPTEFCRRHADGVAAVALFLLPFAIFGHALLPGKVLSPADNLVKFYPWNSLAPGLVPGNPYLTDITHIVHRSIIYAAGEIRQARFPLWNPYEFAGTPFFANPLTAVLFPLTALAYLGPTPLALTLSSVLKLSVAGPAMYWFLRLLSVGPLAGFTGALAFMFNGALVVWLQFPFGTTMIFLPLLLGLTERLRERGDSRSVAGLAIVVAFDILAGYPHGTLYGLLAVTAWALSRARGATGGGRFLARYAMAVGLGTALAAVQWLPFLEYFLESSVFAYRSEWMPTLYVPFRSAITVLMPYFYGSPTGRDFWGDWPFIYITTSVGLVPWLVLPVAVVASWRRAGTKFFLGLATVALAIHHGIPLVSALAKLPGVSFGLNLHLPIPLVEVSLCTLCAYGLDAIAKGACGAGRLSETALRVWFVIVVGTAFVLLLDSYAESARLTMKYPVVVQYAWFLLLLTLSALALLRWLRDRRQTALCGLALAGLELTSLLPLAATYNPVIDARWLYPVTPALRHLQLATAHDKSRVVMPGHVGTVYRLFEVQGYDGMTPRRIEEVVGPIGFRGWREGFRDNPLTVLGSEPIAPLTVLGSPAFDLLGIRYVVLPPGAPSPGRHFTLDYEGPDARVYRNERALPRAFLVPRARCVDDITAVHLISGVAVDFREEVLLADCEGPQAGGPRGKVYSAEIREYGGDRVTISAIADAPAYLVLTDTWFAGWRVWVNGSEHRVWRGNHAFRAVRLAPGQHEIEFRYRPRSFQLGLGLSVLAACVTVGLCLRVKSRHVVP